MSPLMRRRWRASSAASTLGLYLSIIRLRAAAPRARASSRWLPTKNMEARNILRFQLYVSRFLKTNYRRNQVLQTALPLIFPFYDIPLCQLPCITNNLPYTYVMPLVLGMATGRQHSSSSAPLPEAYLPVHMSHELSRVFHAGLRPLQAPKPPHAVVGHLR